MKKWMKRYRVFLILLIVNAIFIAVMPQKGMLSLQITGRNMIDMLSVIPPIFILIGLLDVWLKKETMVKFMGEGSGIVGILLAYFIGSAAAGPLYGAFPVAVVLMKKGCKFSNVLIMVGAWSTTKIPLLLFEATAMGVPFAMLRLGLDVFGILGIAYLTERWISPADKKELYRRAEES